MSVFRRFLTTAILLAGVITSGCHYKLQPSTHGSISGKGDIYVKINGLHNDQGQVVVSLYASDKGFPTEVALSLLTINTGIHAGEANVLFHDIPYGYYAVCILHDENQDGEMEATLLGTPLEGFSFSGRPNYFLGRPQFEDSKFIMMAPKRELELRVRYETGRKGRQKATRAKQLDSGKQ